MYHGHALAPDVVAARRSGFVGVHEMVTVTHSHRWHGAYKTVGIGHLYQGRYKSFPVQGSDHYLTLMRYVESNPRSGVPKIVFASTEHDFGKVASGAKKTCSFDFLNDGGKDLVIEKIHASCGCTTTTAANTTLKPGQTSEIAVTYTAGSFDGKSKKRIMVYTNDPQNAEIALWISADIFRVPKATQTQTALTPTVSKPVS